MSDSGYVFNQRVALDRTSSTTQNDDIVVDKSEEDNFRELLNLPSNATSDTVIEEVPNLSFVQKLAATDSEFESTFVAILRKEFITDFALYFLHIELKEPRMAAEMVHKLKYALGYLNMDQTFNFAELYEEKLHLGDKSSHAQFMKILITVNSFLNSY